MQEQICGKIGEEIDNYQLWFVLHEKERKNREKGGGRHGLMICDGIVNCEIAGTEGVMERKKG